jgi:hypothetical protein
VIHPFDRTNTGRFVDLLNSGNEKVADISSFIIIDKDLKRDVGLDSGIQDRTFVARVDTVYGKMIRDYIKSKAPTLLFAEHRLNFQTECGSYYTLAWLLGATLALQVLFTLPYVAYSSKRQRFIENQYSIPAL